MTKSGHQRAARHPARARILLWLLLGSASGSAFGQTLEDCDGKVFRAPRDYLSYRCYIEVAQETGEYDEAAARLDARLAAAPDNAPAVAALAYLESSREADRAEPLFRRAIELYAAAGEREPGFMCRLELHFWLARRGRLDEADAELDEARRDAERLGHPVFLLRVRLNEASQLQRRSRYGDAERLLRRVEVDVLEHGQFFERYLWHSLMGSGFFMTGQLDEAFRHFERALHEAQLVGWRHGVTSESYHLALVASGRALQSSAESSAREDSIDFVRRTLESAAANGDLRVEAKCNILLSYLDSSVESARAGFRRALEILERTGNSMDHVEALSGLARSHAIDPPVDESRAMLLLARTEEIARQAGIPVPRAEAASARARIQRVIARRAGWHGLARERAIESTMKALESWEAVRDLQPDHVSRARTFGVWGGSYTLAVSDFLGPPEERADPRDVALAFQTLERRQARILLDELDAAHANTVVTGPDPEAAQRERVLGEIVETQRRLLSGWLSREERQQFLDRLARLEIEERELRARLLEAGGRFARIRKLPAIALDELEQALAEDEAFLSYQIVPSTPGWGRSWVFVHTREGTVVHPLPDATETEAAIRLLEGLLLNRDGSASVGAVALYDALLRPALDQLPARIDKLILSPDQALHRLPFGILRDGPHGKPLAERYEISTVPSATLWLHWRRGSADPASKPAWVIADPELPGDAGGTGWRGQDLTRVAALGRLPHATHEARSLARHLGRGTRISRGVTATETVLKNEDLSRYRVLHIAAHAVVDDRYPDRSALVLASRSEQDDGLLQLREIVQLDLDGRVVVLSGCRSASGQVLGGEGVLSLARSFFVAGAHAVIGSLWPLRDEEAAVLFDDFYRYLARGESLAGALAAARRARIEAGAPDAAWAGLVLLGDGNLTPFPGGVRAAGPSVWLPVAGAAVLCAIVVAIRWRRRRNLRHLIRALPDLPPELSR